MCTVPDNPLLQRTGTRAAGSGPRARALHVLRAVERPRAPMDERTMMSIEEKLAIHEMIAKYSYTYDGRDAEGFAQVFVEDGVFEIFGPGNTIPRVRLQSRTEIRTWAAQRLQGRVGRFTSRHYQSGTVFDELTS